MTRMSMCCSSRWVAKLWRKVCGDTRLVISAACAAAWQARVSWRVVIGLTGFWPGNSQPCGCAIRYQSRRSPSSCAESIAWRSLRPLPCSTRSIMRLESISDTFNATISEKRSEVLDPLHVVGLGLRCQLADRHVFDHAPAQRADGLLGHGGAPVLGEVVATPRSQDRTLPSRYGVAIAAPAFPSAYRASGLV